MTSRSGINYKYCKVHWEEETLGGVRPSTICLQIKRIMQDQTSEQEDSGDLPVNVHLLTLRCSIPRHSHTDGRPLNPATNVRRRRSGPTNRESLMWNMERSLHMCSAPLTEGGKAYLDIQCPSCPPPIHQTTD